MKISQQLPRFIEHLIEGGKNMKKKILALLMVLVFALSVFQSEAILVVNAVIPGEDAMPNTEQKIPCTATIDESFAEDRILVVMTNEASLSGKTYKTFDFSEIPCKNISNLTPTTTAIANGKKNGVPFEKTAVGILSNLQEETYHDFSVEKFHKIFSLELNVASKENVLNAIKEIEKRDDVLYAGPDYVLTTCATYTNDTLRSAQWAIEKIDLPEAWDIETDGSSVLIAVMDSGIDADHLELVGRVNTSLSRDFTTGYEVSVAQVTDPRGHGTTVAGVIGAHGNNSLGVTGVCWNSEMVSLRIIGANGLGYSSYAVKAIEYATTREIPIVNFSVTWERPGPRFDVALTSVLLNYDGLFITAAGNNNYYIPSGSTEYLPAQYPHDNILTVGASEGDDTRLEFEVEDEYGEMVTMGSNYGTAVDVFAPGGAILTCFPDELCANPTHTNHDPIHFDAGYHMAHGTSLAAPYVTGIAALMLTVDPSLTTDELKEIIMETVDPVSALNGKCVTGGRVNAYKALQAVT